MCTVAQKRVFHAHKRNAKARGIPFKFAMQEWFTWWEQNLGPDWMILRGCKKGQFVMARKGDKGAYAPDNVECLTVTQNHQDQATNGLAGLKKGCTHPVRVKGSRDFRPNQDGIRISPEDACEIYLMKGTQRAIAAKYQVSERLVRLIKNKQVWQTTLDPLP